MKTLAIVAIAVAVVVFAAPIAGALAQLAINVGLTTVTGAFSLAATLSSALVIGGVSVGLAAGMSLLQKKPQLNQASIDRQNSTINPTAPRKIIFGRTAAGNDVRFEEQYGDKQDGFVQLVALASHKLNAYLEFWVEDDLCWSGGALTSTKRGGFNSATPFLEGNATNGILYGSHNYWTPAFRMTGCAYLAVDWHLSQDVWTTPPTRTTHVVEGCPLYDPRLDDTQGGSGPHRANDQTSWGWRNGSVEIGRNPALALITYLIGYKINGTLVWGMGIPISRINVANFLTYANICEEQVATLAGGTIQRYTCDAILATSDSHETNIAAICGAMGACKLTDVGGQYRIIGGYDDTAGPKIELGPSDFVAGLTWKAAGTTRDSYNIVTGRFADANNLYVLNSWGTITTDPLADGVPRTLTLDLPAVSRAETAQRIAKQFVLKTAKTPGILSSTFGPRAFLVQVGDLVTISHPDQGWQNKLFRVIEQAENHDLLFAMTLQEESSEVYSWDREEKPLPATIRPPGYDPTQTITPLGLAATSASYAGANRVNVSQVTVTWTPETSGRVAGINIESRLSGSTSWGPVTSLADATLGTWTFASNAPGVGVDVRARYRMTTGVYSPWVMTNVATAAVVVQPDWSNVTDDTGTRPDPNATNTRLDTTPIGTGGQTVGGLLTTVNNLQSSSGTVPPDVQATLDRIAAEARQGAPNLLVNGDFADGPNGWSIAAGLNQEVHHGDIGGFLDTNNPTGNALPVFRDVSITGPGPWVVSCEAQTVSGNPAAGIAAQVWSAGYQQLLYGAPAVAAAGWGKRISVALPAQPGAAIVRVIYGLNPGEGLATTRWMVQNGTIATDWNDTASLARASSAVTQLASTSATYVSKVDGISAQLAGTADSGLAQSIAGVNTKAQAGVDAGNAVSSLSTSVTAQFAGTQATNLSGRIGNLETVTTNGSLVSASTFNTLNAQVNNSGGLAAQISNLNQVTSNGTFASASSLNTLSTQINGSGGVAAQASSAYSVSQDNATKLSQARISLAAVAGDGRAQFTLSSDGHDGRWQLVGDGQIDGNLTVNGTLTTGKIADNQITNGDFVINTNTYNPNANANVTAYTGSYNVPTGQYYNSADQATENYPGWQTILNSNYNLPANARLDVIANWKMDCTNGTAWACRMIIDGSTVDESWGNAPLDKVTLVGSKVVGSGGRNITVQWQANNNYAVAPRMKVMWTYK